MTDAMPAADAYLRTRPATFEEIARTSHYLTMRDGVRLAIDVSRPVGATDKLPTIVRQTRYFRSVDPTPLGKWLGESRTDPVNGRMRNFFVSRGYVWIDVDVRGSGASTGVWHSPWSPLEVEDGREILDWIALQPWSNGKVGTTGNSYDGTAAELMATLGHPALLACAPRCSLYDVYTDIAYPGGLRHEWFTDAWTRANQALDAGHPEKMIAGAIAAARPWLMTGVPRRALEAVTRLIFRRVRPVDGDHAAVAAAIATRGENLDVAAAARSVEYRDDKQTTGFGAQTADAFSPSSYLERAKRAAVPTFSLSGWFDAAYPHASIKRHLSLGDPRNRLVLGPWNHGVSQNVSPHAAAAKPAFDLDAELLRFFDEQLCDRPTGFRAEPDVRYYVMGAETWRSADAWPPPSTPRSLYLAGGHTLGDAPAAEGRDTLTHDPETGTGMRSRWRTLTSPFVKADYPDRQARDRRLLSYRSAPLREDLEIAGHPLVELFVTADAPDGAVFAYLEEETATVVHYVTEGALRLVHRKLDDGGDKMFLSAAPYRSFLRSHASPMETGVPQLLSFDLLPVAYRFARGSRIRLVFATADADHFAPIEDAASLQLLRSPAHPSRLVLPGSPG